MSTGQGTRPPTGDAHPAPANGAPPRAPGGLRRTRVAEVEGRRLGSAGRALVVLVLALVFGLLLNAQGLHKAAFNEPVGLERTLALGVTGPLAGTSHALFLDRPRAWVQSALGRSRDDKIDTTIALPAPALQVEHASRETGAAVPGEPVTEARSFTPKDPLRLWVAGDSLVIEPGYALQRAALATPVIKSVGGVDGHIATGLDRPDVFNWFLEIRNELKVLKPNAVVLCFGGNDDKAYMTGLPAGVSIGAFDDPAWQQEYGRRVGGLIDLINRAGAYVVWMGLPITQDPDQTARFDAINAVVDQQIRKRPGGAVYIDTYSLLAGPKGGYSEYLTSLSGQLEDVRAPDGVHLAPAGAAIVARQVLQDLNQAYDLTSWRKAGLKK